MPPSLAGGPCSLENATITYRDPKGALGALTLTTPSLSATIENENPKKDANPKYTVRSFSTADPYQIVGEAIRGTGTGFVFDLAEGSYTFLKDPNFDLRPGASPKLDQKIRLRSRGKADLRRESPAPGAPSCCACATMHSSAWSAPTARAPSRRRGRNCALPSFPTRMPRIPPTSAR